MKIKKEPIILYLLSKALLSNKKDDKMTFKVGSIATSNQKTIPSSYGNLPSEKIVEEVYKKTRRQLSDFNTSIPANNDGSKKDSSDDGSLNVEWSSPRGYSPPIFLDGQGRGLTLPKVAGSSLREQEGGSGIDPLGFDISSKASESSSRGQNEENEVIDPSSIRPHLDEGSDKPSSCCVMS